MQKELFDLEAAEKEKQAGLERAAEKRAADLLFAKKLAIDLARKHPEKICHADMVQRVLIPMGIHLHNAAGSLFRDKRWVWTGTWVKSKRITNHASMRRVWKLVE